MQRARDTMILLTNPQNLFLTRYNKHEVFTTNIHGRGGRNGEEQGEGEIEIFKKVETSPCT